MGADPNKHLLHSCQSGMVAGSRAYVLEPLFQSPEPSSPPAAAVSPQKPGGSAVFCNNQTEDIWERNAKDLKAVAKNMETHEGPWSKLSHKSFLHSALILHHRNCHALDSSVLSCSFSERSTCTSSVRPFPWLKALLQSIMRIKQSKHQHVNAANACL